MSWKLGISIYVSQLTPTYDWVRSVQGPLSFPPRTHGGTIDWNTEHPRLVPGTAGQRNIADVEIYCTAPRGGGIVQTGVLWPGQIRSKWKKGRTRQGFLCSITRDIGSLYLAQLHRVQTPGILLEFEIHIGAAKRPQLLCGFGGWFGAMYTRTWTVGWIFLGGWWVVGGFSPYGHTHVNGYDTKEHFGRAVKASKASLQPANMHSTTTL